MTNGNLEVVGVRAVIQDLASYLAGGKSMEAQNKAIVAASQQVETASQKLQGTWTKEQQLAQNLSNAQAKLKDAENASAAASANHTNIVGNAVKAITGLVSAYAGYEIVKNAITYTTTLGEETYKLGLLTGMTAEQSSSLIFAAEKQGVTFDQLSTGLRVFSRNMTTVQEANDGFTGGAKTTTQILESMGIKVLDTNGKLRPMADLLNDTADFFAKDANATEQAGLSTQLFSRGGAALLPVLNLGSQGLAEAAAMANKLHLQLSEKNMNSIHDFTLAQRDAQASLGGLELELGEKLLPQLTKAADWLTGHQDDFYKFFGRAEDVAVTFVGEFVKGWTLIESALNFIPDHQGPIIAAITAIGVAMITAFGPESLPLIGLTLLVTALGKVVDLSHQIGGGLSPSQDKALQAQAQSIVTANASDEQVIVQKIAALQQEGSKEALIAAQYLTKALDEQVAKTRAAADGTTSLSELEAKRTAIESALKDKVITFAEAEKLGLSAAQAGREEGLLAIKDAEDRGKSAAYDYASTIAAVTTAMQASADAGARMQLDLQNNALKGEKTALNDVFSKPTVEVAELQVALDKVKMANDDLRPSIEADKTAHQEAADKITESTAAQTAALDKETTETAARFQAMGAIIDKQIQEFTTSASNVQAQLSSNLYQGSPLSEVNKKTLQTEADNLALAQKDAQARKAANDADAQASATSFAAQKQALADSTKAQVEAAKDIVAADDKRLKSMSDQEKGISTNITHLQAQSQIWKDEAQLADKTMLTQENQRHFAAILTDQISVTSGHVRDLSDKLGIGLVPSVNEANRLYTIANAAMNPFAVTNLPTLAKATDNVANAMVSAASRMSNLFNQGFAPPGSSSGSSGSGIGGVIGGGSMKPKGFALGGFTSSLGPEIVTVHPNEIILPLNNPARSREILASLPASSYSQVVGPRRAVGDINMSVQGETLETVYAAARATMDKAFKDAESTSSRAGALLANALG